MAAPGAFDISTALDERKLGGFGLRLIVISWFVTFFDGFDMNVMAFTSKYLMRDFHLTTATLGWAFSAGIFGTLLGGFLFGYVGDRVGRRPAIILSVAVFSALTFAIAFAWSLESLMILRFFSGLALGGAIPLMWALNAEFAPKRLRATAITLIMLGYGFGVMVAGPIARLILPRFDWPGVFVFGGLASLLSALLLTAALPESLRFLATQGGRDDLIARTLKRMKVEVPDALGAPAMFVLADEASGRAPRFPLARLFEGHLRWLTPFLWLSYFASSISTFFVASWGPLVLEDLGYSANGAAWVSSLNSLFSMAGGLALMRFTDRHGPISIAVMPLVAIPLLLAAGLTPIALTLFIVLSAAISFFLVGGHYGITSVVSLFYPSVIRANGAGWCSGVAKIGSVLGPLVGGYVLHLVAPVRLTYAILAICPLVYGLAILAVGLIERRFRLGAHDAAVVADATPAE